MALSRDSGAAHSPDREWLERLARRTESDAEAAEELVQDTLLRELLSPAPEPDRRRSWLATILLNRARSRFRSRGRSHRPLDEEGVVPESPPAAEEASRAELQRRIRLAVESLEEPYRTAVSLRYLDDLPPAEISRRLGVRVRTVESRIQRGLARLRARLGGRERRGSWLGLGAWWILVRRRSPEERIHGRWLWSASLGAAAVLTLVAFGPTRELASRALSAPRAIASRASAASKTLVVRPASVPADVGRLEVPAASSRSPARSVLGRAVDRSGRPVGGLPIAFRPGSRKTWSFHTVDFRGSESEAVLTSTDEQGEFRVELDRDARGVLCLGTGSSWVSTAYPVVDPSSPADGVVLVVAPAREVTGTVVDENGRPIEGADVFLHTPTREANLPTIASEWLVAAHPRTVTDSCGSFSLSGAHESPGAVLVVRKERFGSWVRSIEELGAFDRIFARLEQSLEANRLEGIVFDRHGAPLAGALIGGARGLAETNANGEFELETTESEEWITIVAKDHLPKRVRTGAETDLSVTLEGRPSTLSGQILGTDGEPAAGLLVLVADPDVLGYRVTPVLVEGVLSGSGGDWVQVETDAAGRFELHGLQSRPYRVAVVHSRSLWRTERVVDPSDTPSVLWTVPEVELATLEGRITTEGGRPAAGLVVQVIAPILELDAPGSRSDGSTAWHAGRTGRTDARGTFCLEGVDRSQAWLRLTGEGIAEQWIPPDELNAHGAELEVGPPRRLHLRVPNVTDRDLDLELLDARGHPTRFRRSGWPLRPLTRRLEVRPDGVVAVDANDRAVQARLSRGGATLGVTPIDGLHESETLTLSIDGLEGGG